MSLSIYIYWNTRMRQHSRATMTYGGQPPSRLSRINRQQHYHKPYQIHNQ